MNSIFLQYNIFSVSLYIGIVILLVTILGFSSNKIRNSLILKPFDFVHHKKYYKIITSGFIHADFSHLLFNLITFFFFSYQVEISLGKIKYLILFFSCLILSSIPTIIKNKNNENFSSLGASGTILGLIFSYILYNPLSSIYIYFIPIGIPAILFAILYLIYCIIAQRIIKDNINHSSHYWGAL